MSHTLAWIGLAAYSLTFLSRLSEVAAGAAMRRTDWRLPSEWLSLAGGVYVLVILVRVVA